MNRDEYDRLRGQIDKKYRDDLAALELLWRSLQDKPTKQPRRDALELTRMAIGLMRGQEFDVNSVVKKIGELKPDAQVTIAAVSVTLRRLATNPDHDTSDGGTYLELVRPGGPRRAATYRVRRESVPPEALVEPPF